VEVAGNVLVIMIISSLRRVGLYFQ